MVKVMHTVIDPYMEEDFNKEKLHSKIIAMVWHTHFFLTPIRSAHIILLNDQGKILDNQYIGEEAEKPDKTDYIQYIHGLNLCFDHEIINNYNDSFFKIFNLNTHELICEQLPEEIDNYEKFCERMILIFQDSFINELWKKYKNFKISIEAHLLLSKLA